MCEKEMCRLVNLCFCTITKRLSCLILVKIGVTTGHAPTAAAFVEIYFFVFGSHINPYTKICLHRGPVVLSSETCLLKVVIK